MKTRWMGAMMAGWIVVAAGASASPADGMQVFYDNTMVSKHPDGKVFRVQFAPDGSFVVYHEGQVSVQGTYTLAAGRLCMQMDPAKPPACHPFRTDRRVGEHWSEDTPKGVDELSLEAGRSP